MSSEAGSGMPLLQRVRVGNAFEESIENILKHIKLGVFSVGEKLPPERELAQMLGVSRSTLREALQALQLAGYLEIQRGRYGGAMVCTTFDAHLVPFDGTSVPDPREIEDVLLFRKIVEVEAAGLAAQSPLSAGERAHLIACLDSVSTAEAEGYRPKDARFHLAIAEMSGSSMLVTAAAEVLSRIGQILNHIPLLPANLEHSNQQHQELVDAIIRGDSRGARSAAELHLEGTASLLRGFLA